MLKHYSIVIHPQNPIIELFKSFKNKLYKKIGTYGSCNSIAHITILEFEATEEELKFIIEKLERITLKEISFDAVFDKVIYSDLSKAIFVLPNKIGNEFFKKLLVKIRKQIKGDHNKSNAHLTIGRKLKPEQLKKSKDIFPDVKFDFHCNQIAIRRLNKDIGQFEVLKTFPFSGKLDNTEQLSFGF
jgi:2'-5' RNA ligase